MEQCSACGKTVTGGDVMYTAAAALVCPACFDKADLAVTHDRAFASTGLVAAGIVTGVIPFVLSIRVTEGGVSRDWVAVICGLIAIGFGVFAAIGGKGKGRAIGPAAAVIALGAFQLARGFGVL
jgi:hypothetical protein